MKLVWCRECGDIISPGIEKAKRCVCGYTIAKWQDPQRGILHVASRMGEASHLKVLGINNAWLNRSEAVLMSPQWADDEIHKHVAETTSAGAEGYLFKTRNSPIVMVDAGRGDVVYDASLLNDVPWYGKNDFGLKDAESLASLLNRATGGDFSRVVLLVELPQGMGKDAALAEAQKEPCPDEVNPLYFRDNHGTEYVLRIRKAA